MVHVACEDKNMFYNLYLHKFFYGVHMSKVSAKSLLYLIAAVIHFHMLDQ